MPPIFILTALAPGRSEAEEAAVIFSGHISFAICFFCFGPKIFAAIIIFGSGAYINFRLSFLPAAKNKRKRRYTFAPLIFIRSFPFLAAVYWRRLFWPNRK